MKHLSKKSILSVVLLTLTLSNLVQARTLKVMSYNAHNLFDIAHDEGKNDWEYLPKDYPGKKEACEKESNPRYKDRCLQGNWTQAGLDLKVKQLAKVITNTAKPDILAMSEVENRTVVQALADELGYKNIVVTNSPDHRGIDVALLFNEDADIKFIEAHEFIVKGTKSLKEKPTRNILEVVLKIAGENFSIFVNHWPSQGNPTKNRLKAAKLLRKRINKRARKSKGHKFLALGDFNTLKKDFPHPFKTVLLSEVVDTRDKKAVEKQGSKLFSRKPYIQDLSTIFDESRDVQTNAKKALPKGTYFYVRDMTWNMLDRIFLSKNAMESGKAKVDFKSYKIETPDFAVRNFTYNDPTSYMNGTVINKIPFRSAHNTLDIEKAGYSDHFPVSVNIVID
jgi:endonuclease/exonuclease/phosphatase family metal-dependent hydrolase